MSTSEIIHTYRHLYRQGLRAIQFSKPARFTLRGRLRRAFDKNPSTSYDRQKIENTLEFLRYATKENGLEHKIVKNLLFIWWNQERGGHGKPNSRPLTQDNVRVITTAFDAFNHTICMLNESMDMCLPAVTVRDPD